MDVQETKTDTETATYRQNVEEHNKEMAKTEKSQLKYQKLAFIMSMLGTIFMGVILIIVIGLVVYIVPKVNTIYESTMVSLNNLEMLTTELNNADLGGTVQNINTLTVQATGDLSNTMQRLDSIDLEKLNKAIENLNATIEPMAKFFGAMQ
ncbi:MAG: hypothetical protein IKO10_02870 [Lachnospiraceae bacterium]|nr:hypothetical protein [Lachnospiraceae bacterium]